ncbi:carcinoembryonic antigen-related cell adhesion molecule 6-like isoform X1 [Peromyscus leucopus]|uniref:carcinoembryonic antigen-related cell adhesion molecule 6-like isoform X1 n=1 Tax=Peromyscus leucopus TaxID=10041 RepID=UPI001884AD8F|nr:carcinoembryonic antigen-related cell adhesion molecule 6-like isoform X1 [Peromyscus leucopus]
MEPPSALLPTHVPCLQGLLLAASLLTIWNMPSAAAPAIEAVPPAVLEGKNVLLLAHNLPDNLSAYHWFKGKEPLDKDLIIMHEIKSQETKQGKLHSGRETLYPNGSLMLQNVTLKQSGIYNLNIRSAESDQKSMLVEVSIYPQLSKPSIRSNGTTAVEGQDTVEITCDPPFLKTTYTWRLNGKELPGDNNVSLSRGNTTLTLLKVSRHLKGRYECKVQNPLGVFRSNPFTLDVFYGPDNPQIFPPDKYFEEGKNLWLSCQATSHPKAQYSWNVNGEHWSSRQDIFIHKVNMSNSGLYTCHVNNPTTGRNDFKVKEITIVENLLKPHIQIRNRTVLENHLVDLTCVSENTGISILWTFNNERLKATDRVMFSWNNQRLTIRPITKEDAGAYQCEVSNPFISKLSDPVSLDVLYQPSQRNFPMSVPVAAALAVEVLAGLAILGGLAYFVFFKKLNHQEKRRHKKKYKKQKEWTKEKEQRENVKDEEEEDAQ